MSSIRVRFAPSPTGPLHIGGVRTALFNYLFAKKHGGKFLLRIEDTDQKRLVADAEDYIIRALKWCGMEPDESPWSTAEFGPYRQSERSDIYARYVKELVDNNKAYLAFDTPEELDKMRKDAEANGLPSIKYDYNTRKNMRNSLSLSQEEVSELIANGMPSVVRLKNEPGHTITFQDIIRDEVSFSSDELDDKVLMKADGLPTYHMANIVDDHLMQISHVIRGEEWLSSTAHHVLLYRALGWEDEMPKFAHLPLILKPVGKGKLSKRDGAKFNMPVFPLQYNGDEIYPGFQEFGFISSGMINFLALLGWNPGTEEEIFTMEELCQRFDLDRVNKSGARFDFDKAKWFNSKHLQALSSDKLQDLLLAKKEIRDLVAGKEEMLSAVIPLVQERLETLNDFAGQAQLFFITPEVYDEKIVRKKWKKEFTEWFEPMIDIYKNIDDWKAESIERTIKSWIEENEHRLGVIFQMSRLALVGKMAGPGIFDIMDIIGKEETLHRFSKALEHLEASV